MTSKYMALPKGMSESSFDAAIAQFKKALGEDNVMIKDELVRPYTKVMMAVPPKSTHRRPW
jgi:4-cresol dehydrogenase (hydroxylating)